jgi:predicted acylesterase/phospholipase RssA
VFAALALDRLDRLNVGTRVEAQEPLSHHIQAISAVSGGSLAAAAYVAAKLRHEPVAALPFKLADDFLQPVLLGVFDLHESRGTHLEHYWEKQLKLDAHLGQLATRWTSQLQQPSPPFPVPIFNSATLDAHVAVVSPLRWHRYRERLDEIAETKNLYDPLPDPTWVYYRTGVYSLEDFLLNFDPSLAQAVRASANFPFGFPVVQVNTLQGLPFSPSMLDRRHGTKERVRLTDGGAVSNSGLWTLFALLRKHKDTLKERGVILIIIDASKMPEYGGRTSTYNLVQTIFDQSPIASNLHWRMIDTLSDELDGRFGVVEVAIPPIRASNYYTSWALDSGTLKQLRHDAEPELERMASLVKDSWGVLVSGAKVELQVDRLPLD